MMYTPVDPDFARWFYFGRSRPIYKIGTWCGVALFALVGVVTAVGLGLWVAA